MALPDPGSEAEFDRAIAVAASGGGRYDAEVRPGWSAPLGPNGGYLAALAIRALEAELDPAGERRIRSLTCHYLRRPAESPIEFRVEPTRSGRRLAFGRLTALQEGREVLSALAAFAAPGLPEVEVWTPPLPGVDPPGGWQPFDDRMPELLKRVRIAPRFGTGIFSGVPLEPGRAPVAGGWMQLEEPRGLDAALVALFTDVWWPPALEPLTEPAGAPTIDLTIHFRAGLPRAGVADQPVLGRFVSRAATGGLVEEDGAVWSADGTLLAQSRQLALFTRLS